MDHLRDCFYSSLTVYHKRYAVTVYSAYLLLTNRVPFDPDIIEYEMDKADDAIIG